MTLHKYLNANEITRLRESGNKVTIWENNTMYSLSKGKLYFCDVIMKEKEDGKSE